MLGKKKWVFPNNLRKQQDDHFPLRHLSVHQDPAVLDGYPVYHGNVVLFLLLTFKAQICRGSSIRNKMKFLLQIQVFWNFYKYFTWGGGRPSHLGIWQKICQTFMKCLPNRLFASLILHSFDHRKCVAPSSEFPVNIPCEYYTLLDWDIHFHSTHHPFFVMFIYQYLRRQPFKEWYLA